MIDDDSIKEACNRIKKKIHLDAMEMYHNGSIAALESFQNMLRNLDEEYISIKELTEKIIPECIKITIEEHINLQKEIESDYDVDERVYN